MTKFALAALAALTLAISAGCCNKPATTYAAVAPVQSFAPAPPMPAPAPDWNSLSVPLEK